VADFEALLHALTEHCATKLILGNHDRKLRSLFDKNKSIEFHSAIRVGQYLLRHGNEAEEAAEGGVTIMGHEHPAIHLGDGIKGAKFPCFLVSETVLVLPAFSLWAAGSNVRAYPFMSETARGAVFKKAIAICGEKLLPVRLN